MEQKVQEFFQKMEKDPVVVDIYNQADLKNALDDAIKKLLLEVYGFKENHYVMNVKLLLGYAACLFAGIGGAYSYVNSFQDSKLLLAFCCTIYFILTGIMTLFVMFVEGSQIFAGSKTGPVDSQIIRVTTETRKYDEMVTITVFQKSEKGAPYSHQTKKSSIGKWFDVKGRLAFDKVKEDLEELLSKKKK